MIKQRNQSRVAWREQVRLPIVQFVDDARALINGGNFHRFNILNQYLYLEINKLPCLHEIYSKKSQ
jgi:hypothetical protein